MNAWKLRFYQAFMSASRILGINFSERGGAPETGRAVPVGGEEGGAVGGKGRAVGGCVTGKRGDFAVGGHVPKFDGLAGTGYQSAAVGREGELVRRNVMAGQRRSQRARRRIPKLNGGIFVAGGKDFAIRREHQCAHGARARRQTETAGASWNIPYSEGVGLADGGERAAVGGQGELRQARRVRGDARQRGSLEVVPELDRAILETKGNNTAIFSKAGGGTVGVGGDEILETRPAIGVRTTVQQPSERGAAVGIQGDGIAFPRQRDFWTGDVLPRGDVVMFEV